MPALLFHSLLIFLIIFSCLFYGSVTTFPQAVIQTVSALLVVLWLSDMVRRKKYVFLKTNLISILLVFFAVAALQLIPLPAGLVKIISPQTFLYHQQLVPVGFQSGFLTLSINPDATMAELLRLVSYLCIFIVGMHTVETKKQFSFLLNVVIFFGAGISLFGIVQKYCFPEMIYWFDPTASSSAVFGPFINRNNFSGYINMIIPLALGYCLTTMQFARRLVYYCCLGVMCLSLFLCLSRGGIIIFCFSLLLFVVLSKQKDSLRSRKATLLIAFFVLVSLLLFFLEFSSVFKRLVTLYDKNSICVLGHGYSWFDIVRIWRDFPFTGTGLGTFGAISAMYKSSLAQTLFTYAHNDAFQLLAEVGIVGVAAVLLFFYLFFYGVIKEWRSRHSSYATGVVLGGVVSIIATLVYSFLDFNLHIPANAVLFFFIMGLVYRLVYSRFKDEFSVSG
jgi:O-antigen ligase